MLNFIFFFKTKSKVFLINKIECKIVIDFYKWFTALSSEFQTIVLDNFILKLCSIKITEPESNLKEQLPF